MGATLQDLRKQRFPTVNDFAAALGVSPSKAGMILQGRYTMTMTPDEVRQLADLLGVTPQPQMMC